MNNIHIPQRIKSAVLHACSGFAAIDNRAFETMAGDGFKILLQEIFDAGRVLNTSSINVDALIPHPTTFCIVVDQWTEKYTGKKTDLFIVRLFFISWYLFSLDQLGLSYCGISIHYTDRDFRLLNFILRCYPYDAESHSAQHLRTFVDQKLNEYKLRLDSLKYVVTDNEAEILSAFRENCTRIECSDHYIDRQLKHAFQSQQIHVSKTVIENVNCDDIQGLFSTIKNIVSSVRHSHKQQSLPKKLQSYSGTRFNGVLYMLDAFRKLFDELPPVLINSKLIDAYQEIDKQTLDDVCVFLHPFEEVIESLSENKKPRLHSVILLNQYLLNKSHRIKVAWFITREHRLVTILHPNFKKFESCADEKQAASSSHVSIKCASSAWKGLLAQCFDQQQNGLISSAHRYQEIDDNLNRDFYFQEDMGQDEDIHIVDFWRKQQNSFPTLPLIARKILPIPASNTIVERHFSSSKLSVGECRTNLGSEKLNQLMFLQKTLVLLKQLRQVNKSPTKRSISDTVSMMSGYSSEIIVKKKAREDNINSSNNENRNIDLC
ncbi:unnamed protein product [Rotaria sp. Silwood2]|nr:unnamed protein product [Rotaria sp. Silwood2]CAF2753071.1 unnamed protein product [Rotaria sp. Silwood2]CAF3125185.1 unnamed protein product [Rotaria sp. Silwood2]